MSNINIKSDMGGGNPLNIIRIPSLNEIKNIIFKSDLNGSITPGNSNTWKIYMNYMMWSQNNKNDIAYAAEMMNSKMSTNSFEKSATGAVYGGDITSFHPFIEYSE